MSRLTPLLLVVLVAALALETTGSATAAPSRKKAIWGPVERDGVSQFPIYRDLGAGIYETTLNWRDTASSRPGKPTDPSDPAYHWPAELDQAVNGARAAKIKVTLLVYGTPGWANGGRDQSWAPDKPDDYARFIKAAARRYPSVHLWMVWGEPTRGGSFNPLVPEQRPVTGKLKPLNKEQRRGPRIYARMLDASYKALKRVSRKNLVIGGNTYTSGEISPQSWIRYMRLPNGKPPRMDLYGHNPFTFRSPDLRKPLLGPGFIDLNDLDTLVGLLDRYQRQPKGRKLRVFVSELFWPTDHPNSEFNFYVTQRVAAKFLTKTLRLARKWSRIYTIGWFSLYDDPPDGTGTEVNRGLLTFKGKKKPAYKAFKRG